ncbi:hypothetical protein INR49_005597 [Caranx melampygus]|nr:hypothetical protein INR49_005597 [Caranx melampygus]
MSQNEIVLIIQTAVFSAGKYFKMKKARASPEAPCAPGVLKSALLSRVSFLQELHVELSQLFQEAPVRDDAPAFLHVLDGIHHRHVLADHEVREEQRGRPAPPHHTVHQQFICRQVVIDVLLKTTKIAQCLFYKLGRREEILAEVKGRDIFRHHPIVYDVHVAVVTSPRVHTIPRPLCCVQDFHNFILFYSLVPNVDIRPDLVDMSVSHTPTVEDFLQLIAPRCDIFIHWTGVLHCLCNIYLASLTERSESFVFLLERFVVIIVAACCEAVLKGRTWIFSGHIRKQKGQGGVQVTELIQKSNIW